MKKDNDMSIWKNLNFTPVGGSQFSFDANSLAAYPLLKAVIERSTGHLSEFYKDGNIKQEAQNEEDEMMPLAEKNHKYFEGLGGRLIYKHLGNNGDHCIYLWDNSAVEVNTSGEFVFLRVMSHDEEFTRTIKNQFSSQWAPPERTGHIYAIVRNGMHLSLSSIGNAGIALEEGNYTPKVLEDFKYVIKDLQSESPSGRIAIMRGPAGTGKTHLIRGMLLEVPDAMFVLISPEIITNLAGPELLPLLMNYRHNYTGPIVLVIEDADKCLVARESSNMNSIQALLNLGDGILGSLLDMRIVATTNADEFKMDAAITRPGRLSRMLDVGSLDYETARSVFQRLLPNKSFPKELDLEADFPALERSAVKLMSLRTEALKQKDSFRMSLAEVYALARKNGWEPIKRDMEVSDEDEDDE
jgi:hypothetical protein